jgi:exodeoxyribonuclease VII large subunit
MPDIIVPPPPPPPPTLQTFQIPVELKYSPSSIISIFNNLIVAPEEKKVIIMKGIYFQKPGRSYNGIWYDELRDESAESTITLKVPDLLRTKLTSNTTIEVRSYITKRIDNRGSISIQINLIELIEQTHNKHSDEEIKKIDIINKKISAGFRDLDSHIKQYIYNNQKPKIKILHGHSAIIDQDIKTQMAEAIALYEIEFIPTTISSITDIISTLQRQALNTTDIVAISRGGGDIDLKIFDKPELCEYCLSLPSFLISAIGHQADTPLLEKISDKKFSTPTAFGQYLKETYNSTVEEFQKSKAKIVDDVTRTLKANYDKQISNLNQQLTALQELNVKTVAEKDAVYAKQVANLTQQQKAAKELYDKTVEEAKKNHADQLLTMTNKLKSYEELALKTNQEKANLHTTEVTNLKKQIQDLTHLYQTQVKENETLQAGKFKALNDQIQTLQEQQVQKDKLVKQANEMATMYQRRTQEVESKSGVNIGLIIVVIIAIIILIAIAMASKH